MGVIFVAGVHAVGKTTVCQEVAKVCNIPHYSASALIKREKEAAIPQRGKGVADIGSNQDILVRAMRRALAESDGSILLDGHFTLLNKAGKIEQIGLDVFRFLRLDCAVIYQDDPKKIADRLGERDEETLSVDLIADHQYEELLYAKDVSSKLGISLTILNAFDSSGLIEVYNGLA